MTGVAWHPSGTLITTADASGLIRISHLDRHLGARLHIGAARVPGLESHASWTPVGLDVLEGEAWRVLRDSRTQKTETSYGPRRASGTWSATRFVDSDEKQV